MSSASLPLPSAVVACSIACVNVACAAAAACARASDAAGDGEHAHSDGLPSGVELLPRVVEVLGAGDPPAALLGQRASEPPWILASVAFLLVSALGARRVRAVAVLSAVLTDKLGFTVVLGAFFAGCAAPFRFAGPPRWIAPVSPPRRPSGCSSRTSETSR